MYLTSASDARDRIIFILLSSPTNIRNISGYQHSNFKINFQICYALSNSSNLFFAAYSDLKMRLVNSASNKTGRVEIFHPSFGWGTICDHRWDDTNSAVICRQLGFDGATNQPFYGEGSGPVLLDEVHCIGNETYLWDCSHDGWNIHNCHHVLDVGVDCY